MVFQQQVGHRVQRPPVAAHAGAADGEHGGFGAFSGGGGGGQGAFAQGQAGGCAGGQQAAA